MNPFLAGPILVWQARERIHEIKEERIELRIRIPKTVVEKLARVQDLESMRIYRSVTLEEAVDAAVDHYLHSDKIGPSGPRLIA